MTTSPPASTASCGAAPWATTCAGCHAPVDGSVRAKRTSPLSSEVDAAAYAFPDPSIATAGLDAAHSGVEPDVHSAGIAPPGDALAAGQADASVSALPPDGWNAKTPAVPPSGPAASPAPAAGAPWPAGRGIAAG